MRLDGVIKQMSRRYYLSFPNWRGRLGRSEVENKVLEEEKN